MRHSLFLYFDKFPLASLQAGRLQKSLMALVVGISTCHSVIANDIENYILVPSYVDLIRGEDSCGLPSGSRVVVKKDIKFDKQVPHPNPDNTTITANAIIFEDSNVVVSVVNSDNKYYQTILEAGKSAKIIKNCNPVIYLEGGVDWIQFVVKPDLKGTKSMGIPNQIEFFDRDTNGYLQIVYPNPYPGVAVDMAFDIAMSKILSKIKNQEYSSSLSDFNYLRSLREDLPESFYYYHIEALAGAKKIMQLISKPLSI